MIILKILSRLGITGILALTSVVAAAASDLKPLSAEAEAGSKLYAICHVCHNPQLNPALAPPMFGVKRRYQMLYPEQEQFTDHIVSFIKSPKAEDAVMTWAVERLGVMPAQALPDDQLRQIAQYIWEYSFAPPCDHWRNAIQDAGKAGEKEVHLEQDRRMLQKLCQR